MTILILLFIAACFLAYSNGANDNFKGVATLFGSETTNYKNAIWWATNRSAEEAMAWKDAIYEQLEQLQVMPERHGLAHENGEFSTSSLIALSIPR